MTTGTDLVEAIRERASELGIPVKDFAAPLSRDPYQWLKQTRMAQQPKQHTIARVKALLAGEPVAPPPANNFQSVPRGPKILNIRTSFDPATVPDPVDRDPCFWCGIRADVGCSHTR